MGITKSLTLTVSPLNITVKTVCNSVTVKEDEAVTNSPTTALIITKGGGDQNTIASGSSYTFVCPQNQPWLPGQVLGTIATVTGTTTGIQDEQ